MVHVNSISTKYPEDYPDVNKYATTTDTAFVAWLDMNHGIRPVAVVNGDAKGVWCLPISQDEQRQKWLSFRESEYFKHHIKHREYLRLVHSVLRSVAETPIAKSNGSL
jgi:hypothetical protein